MSTSLSAISWPDWRRQASNERGSMLPVMAVVVMVTVAAGALAVDLVRAQGFRHQLQLTADAAALAAAVNLPDRAAARQAAYRYAERNMPGHGELITEDEIIFGIWNPDSREIEPNNDAASAVRVTSRLDASRGNPLSTLFASILGTDALDLAASAVAGKRSAMCILALEPDLRSALAMDFFAEIEALNCTAQVNSRADFAFRILLGSRFLASGLCVTGGVYTSFLASVSPEPTTGCPPQADPLADLPSPDSEGCDFDNTVLTNYHGILQPGIYCGGLKVTGNSSVTLASGNYVIKDGLLAIKGNSHVEGDGIMFYLTGETAQVDFGDSSELSLTAPASGVFAGILVFQDRDFGGDHVWDSRAPTSLFGTIYLPGGHMISRSSSAITPIRSCNVLIARKLTFKFRSRISIDLGQDYCRQYLPAALLGTVALLD